MPIVFCCCVKNDVGEKVAVVDVTIAADRQIGATVEAVTVMVGDKTPPSSRKAEPLLIPVTRPEKTERTVVSDEVSIVEVHVVSTVKGVSAPAENVAITATGVDWYSG